MKKILFVLAITLSFTAAAQSISQKEKDLFYTENRTWLKVQNNRVRNLVNFMKQHNMHSIGYYQTHQTYVRVSAYLSKTRRYSLPGVTIRKHPRFPSSEKGAYVVGVLKGNMAYKSLNFRPSIAGHTFAMFLSNRSNLQSIGGTDMERDGNSYLIPTSLKLFQQPNHFRIAPTEYVNFTSVIVIPLSQVLKLSKENRMRFNQLFYALNRGRQ
ncbi:MAG: hypothetical protein JXR71_12010 [Bacteroidales bacterium]|nr:hypothetical protein [Bacteroidales bacterium]